MMFYGVPNLLLRNCLIKHMLVARFGIQPIHFLPIKP